MNTFYVVLTFLSEDKNHQKKHSNESDWAVLPVVRFIMLYKVVLTFISVNEILQCGHLDESY